MPSAAALINVSFSFLFPFQLAKEAIEVEEKEEKLVSETVKHMTEANLQISYLSEEFTVKSDESRKQKEEITHLLAQVREKKNPEPNHQNFRNPRKLECISFKEPFEASVKKSYLMVKQWNIPLATTEKESIHHCLHAKIQN